MTAVPGPPTSSPQTIFQGIAQRSWSWAKKAFNDIGPGLIVILVVEILLFWALSDVFQNRQVFLTASNFISIGKRMVVTGIMAAGETIVIVAGGFDLSVGSVAAAAGLASASSVEHGAGLAASVLAAILLGGIAGLINGAITGYGRINPLITTLGTLAVFRGMAFVISGNREIVVKDPSFLRMGTGSVGRIPYIVLILLGTYLFFGFIIPRYRFGRYMYAIGSNERAAALAGVRINRWKLVFFGVSGALAGLAGLVTTFRLVTAAPSVNSGSELTVITAVILGGASLQGGRGRLLGTFVGLLFLSILINGLILLSVPTFYQRVAQGAALIGGVLFDEWRRGRRALH